ncbi:MAG TPA: nuclear transport factor 2 family protein [Amycolatopsis sp.]|nr:nuclear transport factor 2 family protein [Amycolatopsis sp.]
MPQNSTADQVRNTLDRWLTAFNEKDADTLFSLYDPDTVYANAGAARMEGVDGLKPWYEEVLKDSSLRVYFKEETLFDSEDLALIAGKFHFRNHSADGSFTPGPAGRVAVLFRRSPDGQWKLAYDMDNTPPDVSAADFA